MHKRLLPVLALLGLISAQTIAANVPAVSKTWRVDCGTGETIGKIIPKVGPGDIVSVVGHCLENVHIPEAAISIVLDGNNRATIEGTDPTLDTVLIYGDEVTVRGFTITGGRGGISLRGALNATVENNVIQKTGGIGIVVHRMSYAQIAGNTIRENAAAGIVLWENSSARIGFKATGASAPTPNLITANGADGIYLLRSSTAWIAGNTIASNGRHGVFLDRMAQADIMSNFIDDNKSHGVFVTQNSGVDLGSSAASRWIDRSNTSRVPNRGFAVQCSIGAYVVGDLGFLSGLAGAKNVTTGCNDTTP
jgi:parallel beta-helix repeat protein